MSFEPVRCVTYVNSMGRSAYEYPADEEITHDDEERGVIIPLAHAEAVERVVKARTAYDAEVNATGDVSAHIAYELEYTMRVLLTTWRPTP